MFHIAITTLQYYTERPDNCFRIYRETTQSPAMTVYNMNNRIIEDTNDTIHNRIKALGAAGELNKLRTHV